MEGQTKGLVDVLTALAAVEEALLNVLDDREERAARRVSRDFSPRAGHPADESTCAKRTKSVDSARDVRATLEPSVLSGRSRTHRWRPGKPREQKRKMREL